VNESLTYAVMLDLLIVAYVKFVIMLIVQKVVSRELKCLNSKTTTVLGEYTITKIMNVPYIFIALEVIKLIV